MKESGFFKFSKYLLLVLTLLSFLTPLWVSKEFLFPFITSKAFYLRILVEMGLPFFVFILMAEPKSRPSYKNPLHISVFVFWVINIISAFTGIDAHKAIWGNFERMGGVFYLSHLILLYFYIVVLGKLNFSFLKIAVYSNIIIATGLSIYGILVRLGMSPVVPDPSLPRVSATFGNPIFFPSYLIPIMFLTIFWGARKKGFSRYLFYSSAFLQLVAIFLSGTRGAVVGLLIGGFIATAFGIFFSKPGKFRTFGSVVVVLLVVLGAVFYLNSSRLPEGSMLRRIFQLRDSNTSARLIQWKVALSGFKDYPFFGTGAENYYVTGNKYFNPEIYKYDPSWFDKPHNYILEILVTNGIFGFTAYFAILISCIWAYYKSWKWGALSLWGTAILFGGLLVYEIQNLFVFDTVSASMTFFIFIGFAGFLWEKLLNPEETKNKKQSVLNQQRIILPKSFSFATFFVIVIFSCYIVWAGNVAPAIASKNTNYGYAYSSVDAHVSEDYFEKAISDPLNFDLSETSSKYQEFAINLLRNPGSNTKDFVDLVVKKCISALETEIAQNPNNPIIWQKLGTLYLNYDYTRGGGIEQKAIDAIDKAISLAPKRVEAMSVKLQVEMLRGNSDSAVAIGRQIVQINPNNLDSMWQLSIALKDAKNIPEAISISENLFDKDYAFPNSQSLDWLLQYYATSKNWGRAIEVAQKYLRLDPNNKDYYIQLAEVYYQAGQKDKATELAIKLIQTDQSLKPKVEKYLPAFPTK